MRPGHILLVEDNPQSRRLARTILELDGHNVQEATNGGDALELLEGSLPDLVLLDLQLPDMDGLEILRYIRDHRATASMPVIAVTARTLPSDRSRTMAAGCSDYLCKPIDPDGFSRTVAQHLQQAREGHA